MELEQYTIEENVTIIDAMKKLDLTANKILYLLEDGKLKGALSDGDVRRWILSGGALDARVSNAINYEPKYIYECERYKAKQFLMKNSIDSVPIVNDELELIDVVIWSDNKIAQKNINLPVVMMAGGKGTRLYPYTKILPKPLIPIGGGR